MKGTQAELGFSTRSNEFRVRIKTELILQFFSECRKAGDKETGGILIGFYIDKNTANLTELRPAPKDSQTGKTWFVRGYSDLTALLKKRWLDEQYYLGEWHFHPGGSPTPSFSDRAQMMTISKSASYQCKEPLLILVGGISIDEFDLRIFVYPHGEERELLRGHSISR